MKTKILYFTICLFILNAAFGQTSNDLKIKCYFTNGNIFNATTVDSIFLRNSVFDKDRFDADSSAVYFSGSDSRATIGDSIIPESGSVTISLWFKPYEFVTPSDTINIISSNNQYIFSSGGQTGSIGEYLYWNKGTLSAGRKTNNSYSAIQKKGFADSTQWHHAVYV